MKSEAHSLINEIIPSFIHSFIDSLIHSFIHKWCSFTENASLAHLALFLVADTQLYEALSVGPLVCWSVGGHLVEKWETERFNYVLCTYVSVYGMGWGVDGGWMPLPTHPQ